MSDPEEPNDVERERKERVLHTRVPAVLEQELKRLAKSLRVPVSNVVRTILEDAVDTVDLVGRRAEDEIRDAAQRMARERARVRRRVEKKPIVTDPPKPDPEAPLSTVIGYHQIVLAQATTCDLTGEALARGSVAYFGVRRSGGGRVISPNAVPALATEPFASGAPNDEPNRDAGEADAQP
ncbi:MAG: hypothetical protein AAGF12_12055 [Myxococcota bacterium]